MRDYDQEQDDPKRRHPSGPRKKHSNGEESLEAGKRSPEHDRHMHVSS